MSISESIQHAQDMSEQETTRKRRTTLDDLLSGTFNSILRVEERSLQNKLTEGLTITEIHTLVALGLHEVNPMSVVANRVGVTLATLTICVNKLVDKGFIDRKRCKEDRRKVLISLSKRGKQVYRMHTLFHRQMVDEALEGLSIEEEEVLTDSLIKVKAFFDRQAEENKA